MMSYKPSTIVTGAILISLLLMTTLSGISNSSTQPTITIDASSVVDHDTARTVAHAHVNALQKTEYVTTDIHDITNDQGNPICYLVTLHPTGYIVVSASFDLPPVITYSFTSSFQGRDDTNPLYTLLVADLTLRLTTLNTLPQTVRAERRLYWQSLLDQSPVLYNGFEQWPPEGSTPTGGWLYTNWHQNAPYNSLCPLDLVNGGRSVAGCPAVAMAQILNYHNTTNNIAFDDGDDYYHNYGGNQYWIDNDYLTYDFPSFPQLNTHLTSLQSHYSNHIPPTNTEKAALVFACGVAARQVYNTGGSGTFGVNQAYDAYQRFNYTSVELMNDNNPLLYPKLSHNMMDALPAHLAVVNPTWTMGHNLVIDGYNTNDYYHLNFGWGGSYNGWYLLPDEVPYGLTVIEGIILNILKEDTGVSDLSGEGQLSWTNVTPNHMVTGTFTLANTGEAGSYLDWAVLEWPSWGTWTFTPPFGNNLTPEDGPVTITANVIAPNVENHLFTGEVKVINIDNQSDALIIPVSLDTSIKLGPDLSCEGDLIWTNVRPGATITASFTVENVGKAFSNLSWEITGWPDWGTWTIQPLSGEDLTPEDGPVTINVSVVAPWRFNRQFTGDITVVNSENSSDYETVPVSLATPYAHQPHIIDFLRVLMDRFPHAFPLLRHLFFH
ncbi:MAG: C10 family peptidase [Candidatus Thermoplasmatota archaeon]|nr:C10 family peptidase [Candidatus Thermoplasmatota archaeon]